MERSKPTAAEIAQVFLRGGNCAQCVLGQYADALGYDREETDRVAACFGGGMLMGHTCGAVTGALMTIGLAGEDGKDSEAKAAEFEKRFRERFGSCTCRELLGYDLSDPEQQVAARASGKMIDLCPQLVLGALEILDDILE